MLSWANPVDGHRYRLRPVGELIGCGVCRGETAGEPLVVLVVLVTRKVRHDGQAAVLAELFSSTT